MKIMLYPVEVKWLKRASIESHKREEWSCLLIRLRGAEGVGVTSLSVIEGEMTKKSSALWALDGKDQSFVHPVNVGYRPMFVSNTEQRYCIPIQELLQRR